MPRPLKKLNVLYRQENKRARQVKLTTTDFYRLFGKLSKEGKEFAITVDNIKRKPITNDPLTTEQWVSPKTINE